MSSTTATQDQDEEAYVAPDLADDTDDRHYPVYNIACHASLSRHKVHEAQRAGQLYDAGRYDEVRELCCYIVQARPSEAILACCHMLLARKEVQGCAANERELHAAKAVRAWQTVIQRTGVSRFPVKEAREGLEMAEDLFAKAHAEAQQELARAVVGRMESTAHEAVKRWLDV